MESRENLAWRVRIAASLVELLSARHLPYRLIVDGILCGVSDSAAGRKPALQKLAEIPLDGSSASSHGQASSRNFSQKGKGGCWIAIAPTSQGESEEQSAFVNVEIGLQSRGLRQRRSMSRLIDLDDDIAGQLNHWLSETVHA